MVELFEQDIRTADRQSSKGNQLKWFRKESWYKADYTGYEGLVEYVVSKLLEMSTLSENEYVKYNTEEIKYKRTNFLGCSSLNFIPEGAQLLTLERLFKNVYNKSLNREIYSIEQNEERLRYLVEQVENITGLKDFGIYMCKLLTIDTFFLNEDRHTHNIAVIMREDGIFEYCPIFDNGASLLSDTTMDYPMDADLFLCMKDAKAKTFCQDFDEQLDIVERLYGKHIKFRFSIKDVEKILEEEPLYPQNAKDRVLNIVARQIRKYEYLIH